jgi:hypothetical protein
MSYLSYRVQSSLSRWTDPIYPKALRYTTDARIYKKKQPKTHELKKQNKKKKKKKKKNKQGEKKTDTKQEAEDQTNPPTSMPKTATATTLPILKAPE